MLCYATTKYPSIVSSLVLTLKHYIVRWRSEPKVIGGRRVGVALLVVYRAPRRSSSVKATNKYAGTRTRTAMVSHP